MTESTGWPYKSRSFKRYTAETAILPVTSVQWLYQHSGSRWESDTREGCAHGLAIPSVGPPPAVDLLKPWPQLISMPTTSVANLLQAHFEQHPPLVLDLLNLPVTQLTAAADGRQRSICRNSAGCCRQGRGGGCRSAQWEFLALKVTQKNHPLCCVIRVAGTPLGRVCVAVPLSVTSRCMSCFTWSDQHVTATRRL